MGNKFTWFPKLTDTLKELAVDFPDLVGEFALAVTAYGTYGTEPDFTNVALKYAFMGIKEDIDNSVAARQQNKGGRPSTRKTPGKTPVSKNETGVTKSGTGVSKNETGVPENETGVRKNETPPYSKPNQAIPSNKPSQTKPSHTNTRDGEGDSLAEFIGECIEAFTEETGRPCRIPSATVCHSLHRILDAGYTVEDVRLVCRSKQAEWGKDARMSKFLRPQTLFGQGFEGYLNAAKDDPEKEVNDAADAFADAF